MNANGYSVITKPCLNIKLMKAKLRILPVNKSYIHILPATGCGNGKGSVSGAAYAAGGKLRHEYRSRSMPDKR